MATALQSSGPPAADLHGSVVVEGPSHDRESVVVPPRSVLTLDGNFALNQQLAKVFSQLYQSQLLNITRHKETNLDLPGAPLYCGTDVRTGRDILLYDYPLLWNGADIAPADFSNAVEQLCCYISMCTPPHQLDLSKPYRPQISLMSVHGLASSSAGDARSNASMPAVSAKSVSDTDFMVRPDTLPAIASTVAMSSMPVGSISAPIVADSILCDSTVVLPVTFGTQTPGAVAQANASNLTNVYTNLAVNSGGSGGSAANLNLPNQDRDTSDGVTLATGTTIKLFPRVFSKYFLRVLQSYINQREKKLVIVLESFQGLFLSSLLAKIKANSQKVRRLHDSLVYKYACNLLDTLIYLSQHKIELKALDPRCIVADTQQCILRLFPSALLTTVTRVDEMIYRHPIEACMAFITGLNLSPYDFFQYKPQIGQALGYWLEKCNDFLALEKNPRAPNAGDHRQPCRDSQSILQENINGLFYHIHDENFDDIDESTSFSNGMQALQLNSQDFQGSPSNLFTSGSSGETASSIDMARGTSITGPTPLHISHGSSATSNSATHGSSVPNFLTLDKAGGSTSVLTVDANVKTKHVQQNQLHTCSTQFNCPCILYLFMKRLLVLPSVYMPFFLKQLAQTIKDTFDTEFSSPLRSYPVLHNNSRLFKLIVDFVAFPIENACFQENERTEYAYIMSPHCSKCCKVLRGMVARFGANIDSGSAPTPVESSMQNKVSNMSSGQNANTNTNANANAYFPFAQKAKVAENMGHAFVGTIKRPCSVGQLPEDVFTEYSSKQPGKCKTMAKQLQGIKLPKTSSSKTLKGAHVLDTEHLNIMDSSVLGSAKSPLECELDFVTAMSSVDHTCSSSLKTATEQHLINSEDKLSIETKAQCARIQGDKNELSNDFDTQVLQRDISKSILELYISSANVSQELSESVEADIVPTTSDCMCSGTFCFDDFYLLRPAPSRYLYSFGLVLLYIATGSDPWTRDTYFLEGLLSSGLPMSLMDVQNSRLCDLITKCIDFSNTFTSFESLLDHEYFKDHLTALQQQQQRDSISTREHMVQSVVHEKERELIAAKANSNPFKMAHGQAKDSAQTSVFSSLVMNQEIGFAVNSERSSVGVASVIDSIVHTDGSTTDYLSDQDTHEPHSPTMGSMVNSRVVSADSQSTGGLAVIIGNEGTRASIKRPGSNDAGASSVMDVDCSSQSVIASTVKHMQQAVHLQSITPNSKESLTPVNTQDLPSTDELSAQLSHQAPTPASNKVYPSYKRAELLTLRDETATLAVVYLTEGNIEKKITLSITSEDDVEAVYIELLKSIDAKKLILSNIETLKSDIESILLTQFYHK